MKKFAAVFALSTLAFYYSHSQDSTTTSGADTVRLVEILSTNRYAYERLDSLTALQILVGQVHLKEKNTHFYADSTVINNNARIIEAFGNVHINDNDSVHTYSQYLHYDLNTKIAILKKKVRLTDDKTNLYTEELEYDVNQKIGIYRNGGRVVNGTSVLTSNEGTYYADIKDVYFKQNVLLKDPQYDLKSDSLLYNTDTEIATFISETFIIDSAKRSIKTREGYYDLKNKKAFFGQRPTITDGAVRIIADQVETDDNTGVNKLRGNAVFVDTAQGLSVLANYIESNRDQGWFQATQHPLMIIKQENDSIYITADTLFSGRLSNLPRDSATSKDIVIKATKDSVKTATVLNTKNDSTDRYFQAYHH
ncbi:MAG TPA: OstA-like protein, partial [Flavitalea sp.]|nr:OstA-like protein [Flavitalea sp.]